MSGNKKPKWKIILPIILCIVLALISYGLYSGGVNIVADSLGTTRSIRPHIKIASGVTATSLDSSEKLNWVRNNVDLSFGRNNIASSRQNLDYASWRDMAVAKADFNDLYNDSLSKQYDIEDTFLHFSKNVSFDLSSRNALTQGYPAIMEDKMYRVLEKRNQMYTDKTVQAYGFAQFPKNMLPKDFTVQACSKKDDGLYIGNPWKIRELTAEISTSAPVNWPGVWEYSTANNEWKALQGSDGTDMLRKSGTFSFNPPPDWKLSDVNGNQLYWVRVRCSATSG